MTFVTAIGKRLRRRTDSGQRRKRLGESDTTRRIKSQFARLPYSERSEGFAVRCGKQVPRFAQNDKVS